MLRCFYLLCIESIINGKQKQRNVKKNKHKLLYCSYSIQMGTVEKEASRPTQRPKQLPNQWVWKATFPGVNQSQRQSDHRPLVLRLRMHAAIPSLPNPSS